MACGVSETCKAQAPARFRTSLAIISSADIAIAGGCREALRRRSWSVSMNLLTGCKYDSLKREQLPFLLVVKA